jgi:ribonucleoside-diphosphate reductase alpha chain
MDCLKFFEMITIEYSCNKIFGVKQMIKYEDVKNQTTEEYFNGNQFSIDAFNKKYTAIEGESYVQALKRVCDYVASVEENDDNKKYWAERWFDEIYNGFWHPAGSIMQGAGCGRNVSLANCTALGFGVLNHDEEWDSLEGIVKNTAYTVAKMAAYRQGLGVDFSRLRPLGTKVLNSSNESQGIIHWMRFIDSIGYYVGQSGRIPAMLFSLNCSHPDVIEFIKTKLDRTKIQNANISVQCTDAFYTAIEQDADWKLHFEIPKTKKGQKVYVDINSANIDYQYDDRKKKWYYIAKRDRVEEKIEKFVKARDILELIAKGMIEYAEPGIQNIDIAKKWSNSDYVYDPEDIYDSRIVATNACSEQYLSNSGCCILSSQNAGKFSTDPDVYEKEQFIIAPSINRFLDNVNECEVKYHTYATPMQRIGIEKLRRTGAGLTNIGGWLFKQNLEYGTKEGNLAISKFTERYNYHLYKGSIELGKEKGSFGLFNREKLEKSPFIKGMMKLGLEFETLRNITCSSIAPTGSLSLMFRDLVMSYGVEPSFGIYYWKRTRITGKYEYYFCVPHVVREVFEKAGYSIPINSDTIKDTWDGKHGKPIANFIDLHKEKISLKFKNPTDISPFDKLDLMSEMMKSVDSSISVTYMLPENTNWEDIYDFIILAHKKGVKSIAAFPDRKMYGIISQIPFRDLAAKLKSEGLEIHNQNFTEEEIKELDSLLKIQSTTCGAIDSSENCDNFIAKRPKSLPCDIHHVKVTKKLDKIRTFEYLVVVGLINGKPWEIFSIENGHLNKEQTKGQIVKHARGKYNLIFQDGTEIKNITYNTTEAEDVVTRLTSALLRSGAAVHHIVDQLEKVEGDVMCFSKCIVKALKYYIQDGTKISGQSCPSCGKDSIIRLEGCATCSICGWSKCG